MRFWDTSALVPLVLEEDGSAAAREMFSADPEVTAWWGTRIEFRAALYRPVQGGRVSRATAERAEALLDRLASAWIEVQPVDVVRETAERLLRGHGLRAGDAVQLGAALVAAEFRPSALPFVCFDDRLAAAARTEGFPVLGIMTRAASSPTAVPTETGAPRLYSRRPIRRPR